MASVDWSLLCGSRRMIPWTDDDGGGDGDIGRCFRDVAVICPAYVVLALLSSYYVGNRTVHLLRNRTHLHLLTARKIVVVGLLLCPMLKLAASFQPMPPLSTFVSAAVQVFAWLVHLIYLAFLRSRISASCRGPIGVVCAWLVTVIVTCLDVRTIIVAGEVQHHRVPAVTWLVGVRPDILLVYIQGALQVLYFCTLVPSGPAQATLPRRLVNLAGSRQPLVADSFSDSYSRPESGYLRQHQHMGVAEADTNFLARLALSWLEPLLQKGCSGQLNSVDDLFQLPSRLKSAYVDTKFWIVFRDLQLRKSLEMEKERLSGDATNPPEAGGRRTVSIPLLSALVRNFLFEYVVLGVLKLVCDCSGFVGPLLLNAIVTYVSSSTQDTVDDSAYYYVAGLFAVSLFGAFCGSQYSYLLSNLKLKVRSSLVSTVYRKTMHLRCSSMSSFDIGEIVNFMGTDTDRIVNMCDSVHAILIQPFQIVVCLYLLHQQLGIAYVAGVAFAVILIPINHWIARKIGHLSVSLMTHKDRRVKAMTELLYGIKVVKYYSWEEHLRNRISALRMAEVKSLKGRKYLDAFCVFFWATTPIMIAALTFTTYLLLGNHLTVAKVFTSLALFNMLIVPLNAIPWVISGVVQGYVSLKRVEKLVQVDEPNPSKCYVSIDEGSGLALYVRNGQFGWHRAVEREPSLEDRGFRLKDIDFEITQGQFVGVCGPVGCGKTSLLLALLAEMDRTAGEMGSSCVAEGFALVADEPWIQNASIKQNILFGKPMQLERYCSVLYSCALDEDLKAFPAGDDTFIGDRGLNLSGGQKTRVALARALYMDKSVYLIDDIFASLDVLVAQHILDNCIHGLLAHKTRVLCTHHRSHLIRADWILMMKDGRVMRQGDPASTLDEPEAEAANGQRNFCERIESTSKDGDGPSSESGEARADENPMPTCTLVEEEWERGSVKASVYFAYALGMGSVVAPIVILSILCLQALRNLSDWWLAHWLSEEPDNAANDTVHLWHLEEVGTGIFDFYFVVYCVLIGSNALVSVVRAFSFAYGGIRAAISFHSRLLEAILGASMRFFDVTPVGRIVNRFSMDTCIVDDDLPFVLNILLAQTFSLLGTLVVICSSLPWLLLLVAPLACVYVNVQYYYRHTSRDLKRLEAVSLSPIYSHFTETVLGLTTIRASRAEARFKRENEERLERNQRIRFCLNAIASWLSLRLQLIGVAVVTGIGFVAILQHNVGGGVDAGLVGLALSYGLSITSTLGAVVQMFTETEKQLVSVERMLQYVDGIEPERWHGFTKPLREWPSHGVVAFHGAQLRYREHLRYALDKVTFSTRPAEKVGIVGRTGAGKSSLFAALFRLVELEKGNITVDDQILAHLDLATLRSQVTIIPQDPFIFSGTVRDNLDPSQKFSDDAVWDALRQCHLEDVIRTYGGLNTELIDRGFDFFSMGQRQLMCLARAILARTKILCIDEATAGVDGDTDRLLQKTIRTAFGDSTVLTIAHRLETVLDSDRILVMSRGSVIEFDAPQELLANRQSHFYRLVHKQEWC